MSRPFYKMENSDTHIPWGKLAWWNVLFSSLYFFRSVSLDIWLASRKTDVDFGELKFGETNLKAVRQILKHIPMNSESTVYELGCGRGRAAFLFHFLTGAKVVAIDVVGPFIVTGRRLARWMGCDQHVLFCYENFLNSDIEKANVIYACALCLGQETREALSERIARCRSGTYLISVGWAPKHRWLKPLESFSCRFSWGTATIYLNVIDHQLAAEPE
jgi:SAM-dependent methyltransferase